MLHLCVLVESGTCLEARHIFRGVEPCPQSCKRCTKGRSSKTRFPGGVLNPSQDAVVINQAPCATIAGPFVEVREAGFCIGCFIQDSPGYDRALQPKGGPAYRPSAGKS